MSDRGRPEDEAARREGIVHAVRTACQAGDLRGVAELLAADASAVVELADGDRVVLRGRTQVATRLASVIRAGDDAAVREVNSQPGIVILTDGRVSGVIAVRVVGAVVAECWVLLNPDRLGQFSH